MNSSLPPTSPSIPGIYLNPNHQKNEENRSFLRLFSKSVENTKTPSFTLKVGDFPPLSQSLSPTFKPFDVEFDPESKKSAISTQNNLKPPSSKNGKLSVHSNGSSMVSKHDSSSEPLEETIMEKAFLGRLHIHPKRSIEGSVQPGDEMAGLLGCPTGREEASTVGTEVITEEMQILGTSTGGIRNTVSQVFDDLPPYFRGESSGQLLTYSMGGTTAKVMWWLGKQVWALAELHLRPLWQCSFGNTTGACISYGNCSNQFSILAEDLSLEGQMDDREEGLNGVRLSFAQQVLQLLHDMKDTSTGVNNSRKSTPKVVIRHPETKEIITLDSPKKISSCPTTPASNSLPNSSKRAKKKKKKQQKKAAKKVLEASILEDRMESKIQEVTVPGTSTQTSTHILEDYLLNFTLESEDEACTGRHSRLQHSYIKEKKNRNTSLDYLDLHGVSSLKISEGVSMGENMLHTPIKFHKTESKPKNTHMHSYNLRSKDKKAKFHNS